VTMRVLVMIVVMALTVCQVLAAMLRAIAGHAISMPEKSHCSTSVTTSRAHMPERCNRLRIAARRSVEVSPGSRGGSGSAAND